MKHVSRSVIAVFLMLLIKPLVTAAQEATAPSPIIITGFADVFYSKNFADPASGTNKLRNFDTPENQIIFSLGEISFQKKADPVGFRADLDFGATHDAVNGFGSTLAPFQQAYLTAVLPIGSGLTVDIGKFVTHMGFEVIESKDNWNYSRSLLFSWAIPYYHTGVRLSYPLMGNLTLGVHVVQGWNTVIDINKKMSLGLTLNYAATPTTTVILNGMSGVEQPSAAIFGKKNVGDICVIQTLDNLSLGLNADYGEERVAAGLATWKGVAVYGKYAINDKAAFALRGEIYSDPVGYSMGTGTMKSTLKEITVTLEHKVLDALVGRLEFRDDFANSALFEDEYGVITNNSQATILVGLVATF